MKRFVDGVDGELFFQKRVPKSAPDWLQTATVTFPSGRSATELVANDAAHLVWAVNLGSDRLQPAAGAPRRPRPPRRAARRPRPAARACAGTTCARSRCASTRCSRSTAASAIRRPPARAGIHVNVRIEPRWDFIEVRRAALALAREVERRLPGRATSKWWKEERHGVFVDYNQNARDRTIASAYSVRPVPDAARLLPARVGRGRRTSSRPSCGSTPSRPAAQERRPGGRHRRRTRGSLDELLDLARRDEDGGLGDAPWPPHFAKQRGEPKRVQPSRAREDDPGLRAWSRSSPALERHRRRPTARRIARAARRQLVLVARREDRAQRRWPTSSAAARSRRGRPGWTTTLRQRSPSRRRPLHLLVDDAGAAWRGRFAETGGSNVRRQHAS